MEFSDWMKRLGAPQFPTPEREALERKLGMTEAELATARYRLALLAKAVSEHPGISNSSRWEIAEAVERGMREAGWR